jgi:hypothetical protein
MLLDSDSRLNLATFVTTWMEPEAEKLVAEAFDKNMIDKDEYPNSSTTPAGFSHTWRFTQRTRSQAFGRSTNRLLQQGPGVRRFSAFQDSVGDQVGEDDATFLARVKTVADE